MRYRYDDLKLSLGDHGKVVFDDKYIMETKALNSLPYWFCNILSEMNLKPISYSKFGEIYKEEMNKNV